MNARTAVVGVLVLLIAASVAFFAARGSQGPFPFLSVYEPVASATTHPGGANDGTRSDYWIYSFRASFDEVLSQADRDLKAAGLLGGKVKKEGPTFVATYHRTEARKGQSPSTTPIKIVTISSAKVEFDSNQSQTRESEPWVTVVVADLNTHRGFWRSLWEGWGKAEQKPYPQYRLVPAPRSNPKA